MEDSKLIKNGHNIDNRNHHSIESLPTEVLEVIAAKVASSSMKDMFRLRGTNKKWKSICDSDFVIEHSEVHIFYYYRTIGAYTRWTKFYECSLVCGNHELHFRRALILAFDSNTTDLTSKMRILRPLAKKGHTSSMFIVGIFNFAVNMYSPNVKEANMVYTEGLEYFSHVRKAKQVTNSINAIRKVFIFCAATPNDIIKADRFLCNPTSCLNPWTVRQEAFYFVSDEDDLMDPTQCLDCRIDEELMWFYSLKR